LVDGEVVDQRFRMLCIAGSGGMGTVYGALDLRTGQRVALKILTAHGATSIERFELEISIVEQLSHPRIVRYVAHGRTGRGEPYLAMEWLDGETLRARLDRERLTMRQSVQIARDVADALAGAHASGVIHRDLKPGNIILESDDPERSKVLDFGIARFYADDRELTLTNQIMGTPGYMAPEQAQGLRQIDARVDLFSLGCVLFRCLTGFPAFSGHDPLAVLAKVVADEPPPIRVLIPEAPAELDALVTRLLAKAPADRPASAEEVRAALDYILEQLEHGAAVPSGLESHRRPVLSAACVLLAQPNVAGTFKADEETFDRASRAIAAQGGKLQQLANGTLLVTLVDPTLDEPERAAECARALSAAFGQAQVSIALADTVRIDARSTSELIDRATRLLADGSPGSVRIPAGGHNPEFPRLLAQALERRGLALELRDTREPLPLAAPASTLDMTRHSPALTPRRKRLLVWGGGVAAILLVLGGAAVGVRAIVGKDALDAEPGTSFALSSREREIRERACAEWSASLAKSQRPDGSFGTETHRPPSGWNTGQTLTALTQARLACGKVAGTQLSGGVGALGRLRLETGWGGPTETPRSETPATAWAALALGGAFQALGDAAVREQAVQARDLLLRAQQSDGSFRFLPDKPTNETNGYTTVLALWALIEVEPLAPSEPARAARARAMTWLRTALSHDVDEPPLRRVAGLAEQATWVLLRGRARTQDHHPNDAELLREAAEGIVERCQLSRDPELACTRALNDDGQTYLERKPGRGPNLVTLWHPWATLSAHALATDTSLGLPADLRADLAAIARWGLREIEPAIPMMSTAPAYKLAEYLYAIAALSPAD
jgi:hypothetical protein